MSVNADWLSRVLDCQRTSLENTGFAQGARAVCICFKKNKVMFSDTLDSAPKNVARRQERGRDLSVQDTEK